MYAVMAQSVGVRQRIGTVAVTCMAITSSGGFGVTSLTLMSLEVIVGGVSKRPRVVDGQVGIRDVLDLALAIDHNVVDGAPAARFAAEFRELLESASVISPPGWTRRAQLSAPTVLCPCHEKTGMPVNVVCPSAGSGRPRGLCRSPRRRERKHLT